MNKLASFTKCFYNTFRIKTGQLIVVITSTSIDGKCGITFLFATRGQCYKTFYGCKLRIFVLKQSVCQASLENLARDKHSSLLRKFVNYGQKIIITLPNVFTAVIYKCSKQASGFDPGNSFQPSLMLVGKSRSLPLNIIPGCKGLPGTNTLVYHKHS